MRRKAYKPSNNAYIPTYPAAIGYDFATGIGTINAANLVKNLATPLNRSRPGVLAKLTQASHME
jgi:hypothetical protein